MAAKKLLAAALSFAILACAATLPAATQANEALSKAPRRQIVVISDLHFGLGKGTDGKWDPQEDFRWTNALWGFLSSVGETGANNVDLVIAGDLLELWQLPDDIRCDGGDDTACSVYQMQSVVRHVVAQHDADLKLLGDFAKRGDNRLFIIPGNHDAALLVPEIWTDVAKLLDVAAGRVILVSSGVWASADGQVVIEHGHQIGADVNAFAGWPTVTAVKGGKLFLHSPWGERFVQKLFNAEEKVYPIIDNLSPESTGARLRLADRGLWRSTRDVARFVAFNLFETTFAQKAQSLGTSEKAGEPCTRREAEALGYRLFASALPPGDAFRAELEGSSPEALALQVQLNELVKTLTEDELAQICRQRTSTQSLGGILESTFVPREDVLRAHTIKRLDTFPNMKVFIYAHTHQLEPAWDLTLGLLSSVTVLNTGAFQRLIDETGYNQLVKKMNLAKASDGLSKIPLDSLAPCYSFVAVQAGDGGMKPAAATKLWRMAEGDQQGFIVAPGDNACQ